MIEIYTRSDCQWSFAAKRLLMIQGLAFTEFAIDRSDEARVRFDALDSPGTVPQVVVNGTRVGGYEALAAAVDSGDLAAMITKE